MHEVVMCAVSMVVGIAISEYYNRGRIDAIRREQIDDLKRSTVPRKRAVPPDDLMEGLDFRPAQHPKQRRSHDLVSPEQYEEYVRTGTTRGKRIGGADT